MATELAAIAEEAFHAAVKIAKAIEESSTPVLSVGFRVFKELNRRRSSSSTNVRRGGMRLKVLHRGDDRKHDRLSSLRVSRQNNLMMMLWLLEVNRESCVEGRRRRRIAVS